MSKTFSEVCFHRYATTSVIAIAMKVGNYHFVMSPSHSQFPRIQHQFTRISLLVYLIAHKNATKTV